MSPITAPTWSHAAATWTYLWYRLRRRCVDRAALALGSGGARGYAHIGVIEELPPAARHVTEQYANNPIETDHGRLKSRLRPMRGPTQLRSGRVISTGHAFVQNLRRGHYELGVDTDPRHRLVAAFTELTLAI
jgi:transposase-like protein